MPAGNPKRFASLGRTLELLSPTSPATCTISLMDSTARERRLAGAGGRLPDRQFSDIRVRQAGPAEHRLRVAPPPAGGKDLLLGKFNCRAGNPIVIEVSDRPVPEKQETWHSWQLPGPCAALRTLAADRNATPAPGTAVVRQAMSRGPRPAGGDQVWDVEVLVADNNKTVYSLWLTVSFDKDLPELGEWSQPIK